MVIWLRIAGLLLVGYLCGKRSFAYVGVPPVFIGEIVLGAFLVLKPRVALGTWVTSLLRPSPLNGLGLSLLLFMIYGVWQVLRGLFAGRPVVYTLQFFVYNYYVLYIFLGIWVIVHFPDRLQKLVRVLAWCNGIYGLAYIVALRLVTATIPGSEVPLFSPAGGGAAAILGLLCFERNLRASWIVLMLNITVTLAWQVRSEWLGLALGAFVWAALTGNLARFIGIGMAGLALLCAIEFAGIRLAGHAGDDVTLSETLARAVAPIDRDLAEEFSPNADKHAGNAEWRTKWWREIWLSVHSTAALEAFGHGYGFDLFGLAPAEVRAGQPEELRTPHSVFYFALGYTGWVGVVVFAVLQLAILQLLWRSYRVTGQPAGVVWWVMGIAMGLFEESFETPFKAIPLYILLGMGMAPGLMQAREARSAHAPDLSGRRNAPGGFRSEAQRLKRSGSARPCQAP